MKSHQLLKKRYNESRDNKKNESLSAYNYWKIFITPSIFPRQIGHSRLAWCNSAHCSQNPDIFEQFLLNVENKSSSPVDI